MRPWPGVERGVVIAASARTAPRSCNTCACGLGMVTSECPYSTSTLLTVIAFASDGRSGEAVAPLCRACFTELNEDTAHSLHQSIAWRQYCDIRVAPRAD